MNKDHDLTEEEALATLQLWDAQGRLIHVGEWLPKDEAILGIAVRNVFCPTGPGGGIDATCSPPTALVAEQHPGRPAFLGHPANPGAPDTDRAYRDSTGRFTADREYQVHEPMLKSMLQDVPHAVGPPVLYMTGGGWGSGKSTLLDKFPEVVGFPGKDQAVRSDPDALKAFIPEYQKYAVKGNKFAAAAPSFVHEESAYVAKEGVRVGLQSGRNVVYDTSGDSGIAKLDAKVRDFRAAGASRVEGHYAFPGSIEEAQARADRRAAHSQGLRREVFPPDLRANHIDMAKTWFAAVKARTYDRQTLWSTAGPSGSAPTLIAEASDGHVAVHDHAMFRRFIAVAKEKK